MNPLKRFFATALILLVSASAVMAAPSVEMQTTLGRIVIELNAEKAPITVENFLKYVNEGFYDGTIFHRVIGDFMIQGGGFIAPMEEKLTGKPIKNEAYNGLRNLRGTIAMAHRSDPHSATAQFFINRNNNPQLDHPGHDGWGYAVFGKVTEGLNVIDEIAKVPTGKRGSYQNVPLEPIIIQSIKVLPPTESKESP